jgi:hypothetical protein
MILNLKIFLDILMFSRGPQDLPSSSNLLKAIILLNIIIGLISVDPNTGYAVSIFFVAVYILVTLVFIKLCLGIKDNSNEAPSLYASRYIQVSSGTLGVHAFVSLFASIVTMYMFTDENSILLIFLAISLYAWFVNGHIFKNALDTTMSIGLGISLLHNIIYVFIIMILVQVLLI